MWKLDDLRERNIPCTCLNGKWIPARPINYKYRSLKERFVEAWKVFTGKADCFTWPEGQ